MAGAMGNCYDRLVFGYVRDFVHFHVDAIGFDCAIFNFADNMLVAGAITLVLYALRPENAAPAGRGSPPAATRPRSDRLAVVLIRPMPSTARSLSAIPPASHVVVECELVGVRADPDRLDFVGLLVPDPGVDDVGGEDVAAEQELVVGLAGPRARLRATAGWSGRSRALRAGGRRCPCRAGSPGRSLFWMPSRTAMSMAEKSR